MTDAGATRPSITAATRRNDRQRGHSSALVDPLGGSSGERSPGDDFTIFAAMPFDPTFDDVFYVAIEAAARSSGGRAVRVDQVMHGDDAVLATKREIERCRVVVADLSTNEPDVLYELGMAHALGKPTVQICRRAFDDLPFMVRNRETLLYQEGGTYLLGQQLGVYLRHILATL